MQEGVRKESEGGRHGEVRGEKGEREKESESEWRGPCIQCIF